MRVKLAQEQGASVPLAVPAASTGPSLVKNGYLFLRSSGHVRYDRAHRGVAHSLSSFFTPHRLQRPVPELFAGRSGRNATLRSRTESCCTTNTKECVTALDHHLIRCISVWFALWWGEGL